MVWSIHDIVFLKVPSLKFVTTTTINTQTTVGGKFITSTGSTNKKNDPYEDMMNKNPRKYCTFVITCASTIQQGGKE